MAQRLRLASPRNIAVLGRLGGWTRSLRGPTDVISVAKLVHGTTVATSTILERKGARTASWRIPPATTMPVLPVHRSG